MGGEDDYMKKLISIFSPAYNEEENIQRCYEAVRDIMAPLADRYDYEHLFGDNCSTDRTLELLRELAARDRRVKVLTYTRNWGPNRNGMTLLRHCSGDAVIPLASDLQEPVAVIPQLIALWEAGNEIVYGIYTNEADGLLVKLFRRGYYWLVNKLSNEPLIANYSGFGIWDRKVARIIADLDDFNPNARGVLATIGFKSVRLTYARVGRKAGRSSYTFASYLDEAINAIITHSLVPIRLATLLGLGLSGFSLFAAFAYAMIKVFNWSFQAPGATTTVVLVLFFSGIQLFFLGMLGEYIGAIHAQVRRGPFTIIRERINFDENAAGPDGHERT
jgi:glycosyltransferase involved in cell wall biosynthesis